MALFKDMLKKWFYTTGTNPELTATSRVPVLDGSGNAVGSTQISNLAQSVAKGIMGRDSIEIMQGDDLDNYRERGSFKCSSQSVAQTLQNADYTGGGFVLLVFSAYSDTDWTIQFSISHSRFSVRFRLSNGWSPWRVLATNT